MKSYKEFIIEESEYQGKEVKLNDPFRTPDGPKKFSVYVKNEKGNVVKVNFGDPNMEIKRDDPARRKSFRARHNCDDPGPKWKARYWSCYQWRAGSKVDEEKPCWPGYKQIGMKKKNGKKVTNCVPEENIKEDIKVPIKVGDTILGGRFKNKKIKVKEISKNEKGDITINGKPLLKYRILKNS